MPLLRGLVVAIVLCTSATAQQAAPRPAVARIVVQEQGGAAFGSGSLVDARGEYGLVVTNWHVVRDATGPIEVIFPSGFRSEARSLKLDEDWDLAALVIWRPPVMPLPLATHAPQPGEPLTICGYGSGLYREASGRCIDYYSPEIGLPQELVELNVEARQGDSGGPILNARGEIAGVLFGAGQGTTLGSFGGRVGTFLASLSPGLRPGRQPATSPALQSPRLMAPVPMQPSAEPAMVAVAPKPTRPSPTPSTQPAPAWQQDLMAASPQATAPTVSQRSPSLMPPTSSSDAPAGDEAFVDWNTAPSIAAAPTIAAAPAASTTCEEITAVQTSVHAPVAALPTDMQYTSAPAWFDQAKTIFAVVGVVFVLLQLVRMVT
ncbi:MAG: trypsin-like peptidase domain-containing protein [Planctomycetota bacterium]